MDSKNIFLFTSSSFLKKVFLGALFILICISAFTYRHTIALSDSTASVIHSQQVHLEIEQLMSYIKDAETGQRGYVLTQNPTFLQPYNGSREKVESSFKLLKKLTSNNPKQQSNLDTLHKIIDLRYVLFKKSFTLITEKPVNEVELNKATVDGKAAMDEIRFRISEMIRLEMVYLKERKAKYDNEISFTPIFTLSLFFFTILIFAVSYLMINRDLKNVKKANEELLIMNESINQTEEVGSIGNWQWNLENNTFVYSDNLFRILGTNPQSFKSNAENFIDFVHPEDKHILIDGLERVIKENRTSFHLFRIIRKDGELRYFTSNSKILEDKNGKKVVVGVTIDITAIHLTQLGIEQRNRELEIANTELVIKDESINQAQRIGNFGLAQWNLHTKEVILSDNLYRILGCEPNSFEPTTQSYINFVHPEDKFILDKLMDDVLNRSQTYAHSYRIIRADGEIRFFKSISTIIVRKHLKTMVSVVSDMTEQYSINQSLEERNLELEQINKELASFNYVASHDLQEPLRKIQLFISRIEENEKHTLSEVGKEYFDRINVSALRMRVLIDDLLLFSRTNKAEKNFEKADLNLILNKAKNELSEVVRDKNGVIQSTRMPVLKVIPYQIEQLFINLISNSLKYSKQGLAPCINIECEKVKGKEYSPFKVSGEKKYFKFTFTDNGLGFEQKNAESIFTLFHRLHHKTEYSGTGIGLSICKKIVENHGGFITAQGTPNEGSTFMFFLPE